MQTVTTIGLDIAKSVFQVHGVDASGQVVIRRQLKRRSVLAFFQKLSPCLVGIEACAPCVPYRARYSTAQYQEADFGVRSADLGLAPVQPNQQTSSLHSR